MGRKSLDGLEKIVGRNIDTKVGSGGLRKKGEQWRKHFSSERIYFMIIIIIMNRMLLNRNVRGASGEVLDGNEKRVIGNWKKDDPYYKMTEVLAITCKQYTWISQVVKVQPGFS